MESVFQAIASRLDNAPLNFHECNIYRVDAITVPPSFPYTLCEWQKLSPTARIYLYRIGVFFCVNSSDNGRSQMTGRQ